MIIAESRMYPLSEYLSGLERAGNGVLRVRKDSGDRPAVCTGWLVTDRLLVVPRFGVAWQEESPPDRFLCSTGDGVEIGAQLVHLPSPKDHLRPALLRLDTPQPDHALRLDVASPESGQRVLLLHHPEGRPETHLSLGRVLTVTPTLIRHDASTLGGSSGGPVLSADTFAVIGMHVGRASDPQAFHNEAVVLAEMLEELRSSTTWDEIARHHQLADVGAAYRELARAPTAPGDTDVVAGAPTGGPDPDLLAAALRWSLDPAELDAGLRERLRPLVGDPEAPRWSCLGDERRRLVKEAGSLAALREARAPAGGTEPGQRAIDRILEGPPFDLAEITDDELPYWLQTVGWFADVVPGLPSAAEVHQTLARRRVRGRLGGVAGPRLWGREAELDRLLAWYRDPEAGPMAVTGIGGVGKSALVARFALDLPTHTLLLWLDFDRADLAPDDAVSVLGSLAEQVSVQLDDVAVPPIDASAWEKGADTLGSALARAVPEGQPPLLVLDGFEIAQHVERYEEIWDVLGRLLLKLPSLRVIVSGRAPVPGLAMAGRPADTLHLTGLSRGAARAWLLERRVTDPVVLAAVLRVADGVPLVLKLAVRLVEAGGDVAAVPEELPRALIDGYLYQRILDRVVDHALRPLARDALVLRRLSAEMVTAVLGDRVPEGLDGPAVFARLSRELALVETLDTRSPVPLATPDTGPLRLRPEVRTATLRLLELDTPERVREIDRRAVAWYTRQDPANVATAAELVYHHLRLGDVAAAEEAWRDGCAPLLLHAGEDIPEAFEPARTWLRAHTTGANDPVAVLAVSDVESHERLRSALSRGLVRTVPAILRERQERSPESPLTVYDAWVRWQVEGDLAGAWALLDAAGSAPGPIGRERAVLGALLAVESGDRVAADALLAPLDDPAGWSDRADGFAEALAVRAARVRMAVDLQGELDLAELLDGDDPEGVLLGTLRQVLTPGDLVLPPLSRMVQQGLELESYRKPPVIPSTPGQLAEFAERLDQERRSTRTGPSTAPGLSLGDVFAPQDPDEAWTASELGLDPLMLTREPLPTPLDGGLELGLHLAVLARRRWRMAAHTTFLADVFETVLRASVMDALGLALVGTLAAFRGQALRYSKDGDLTELIRTAVVDRPTLVGPVPFDDGPAVTRALLRHEDSHERVELSREIEERLDGAREAATSGWLELPDEGWRTGNNALIVYLLGPDPLDVLHRRVLGIPDSASEGWR